MVYKKNRLFFALATICCSLYFFSGCNEVNNGPDALNSKTATTSATNNKSFSEVLAVRPARTEKENLMIQKSGIERSEQKYERYLKNSANPYNNIGVTHNDIMHYVAGVRADLKEKGKKLKGGTDEHFAAISDFFVERQKTVRDNTEKDNLSKEIKTLSKAVHKELSKKQESGSKAYIKSLENMGIKSPDGQKYMAQIQYWGLIFDGYTDSETVQNLEYILQQLSEVENNILRAGNLKEHEREYLLSNVAIAKHSSVFWRDAVAAKMKRVSIQLYGDDTLEPTPPGGAGGTPVYTLPDVVVTAYPNTYLVRASSPISVVVAWTGAGTYYSDAYRVENINGVPVMVNLPAADRNAILRYYNRQNLAYALAMDIEAALSFGTVIRFDSMFNINSLSKAITAVAEAIEYSNAEVTAALATVAAGVASSQAYTDGSLTPP